MRNAVSNDAPWVPCDEPVAAAAGLETVTPRGQVEELPGAPPAGAVRAAELSGGRMTYRAAYPAAAGATTPPPVEVQYDA